MNRKRKTAEDSIFCRRDTKRLLAAALISLLVLAALVSRGARFPQEETPAGQNVNEWAWWGCLYPGTCLESAMRLTEAPENSRTADGGREVKVPGQGIPVKIKWKCMDLF